MTRRLTANNVPRKDTPPMNAAFDAAIAADYRAGMPVLEILSQHEISTTILYRAVKDADRTLRRAARAALDAAVIADYRAGMPVLDILRRHEISTTISLPRRKRRRPHPAPRRPRRPRCRRNRRLSRRHAGPRYTAPARNQHDHSLPRRKRRRLHPAPHRPRQRSRQARRRQAALAARDAAIAADYRAGMPLAELCRNREGASAAHSDAPADAPESVVILKDKVSLKQRRTG